MSKMKSKFRPKSKTNTIQKPSEPQVWCVEVTEYEKEWGIRKDDLLEFPSEAKARAHAEQYNKMSAEKDTPDHSFHAVAFPKESAKNQ